MLSKYKSQFIILLAFLIVLLAQLACISSGEEELEGTVEALSQMISLTSTAGSSVDSSSVDSVKTAEAKGTENANAIAQTQAAQEEYVSSGQAATATAIAPILRELPKYDVDSEEGYVSWIYPPVTLEVEGYMSSDFENRFLFTTIKDFVISSDITWNTQYGTSGCGFVLRSDGKEEKGNNYMIILSRVAEGHVVFLTVANGELVKMDDMYVPLKDPKFSWPNDSTNRLTVVGRGNIFTIYSNDYLIGEVIGGEPPKEPVYPTPPPKPESGAAASAIDRYNRLYAQYEEEIEEAKASHRRQMQLYEQYNTDYREGFMTLGAVNESGYTTCQFDNTWLFTIEAE
jgi:hypothetical protein